MQFVCQDSAKFSSIDRGPNSAQIVVKVESQKGAVAYDMHHALEGTGGVLAPWTLMTLMPFISA
jgi:hypothetical protein